MTDRWRVAAALTPRTRVVLINTPHNPTGRICPAHALQALAALLEAASRRHGRTYSKSALAPGQRLGYLALPPAMPARTDLRLALPAVGLASGNWLPDAVMQYALADIDPMSIDLAALQARRDRMATALRAHGYAPRLPEATFYLLVRAPIEDDVEFARRLRRDRVLVLPGRTVEMPGDGRHGRSRAPGLRGRGVRAAIGPQARRNRR